MRMDTQAKKEIRSLAHRITNGAVKVEYPGLADRGFVRVIFKAAGMKPRQMQFDRVSRKRTDLPDTIRAAREIIEDMQAKLQARIGTFGQILKEAAARAAADAEPESPPESPEPEVSQPQHEPVKEIAAVSDLPTKEFMKMPAPVPPVATPGTTSYLRNKEIARATKLLVLIGDADEDAGAYAYLPGYDDEVLRALVNPEVRVEAFIKLRREAFGKIPSEIKPKKLSKDEQIAALTARIDKLEAENAALRAQLPKPRLTLPSLNGSGTAPRPHEVRTGA